MVQAAFSLFLEHGFDNVTMEQVAQAAGVSRSTAYRRFATKEEVVLEVPKRWLEAFDRALDGLDEDADLAQALRATCMAVAIHIDQNIDLVRQAYAVLELAASLRASGAATTAWLERFVLLIDRFGQAAGDPMTAERVEITTTVAGAYLGAIDATMQRWADDGGRESVEGLIDRMLDRMEPML